MPLFARCEEVQKTLGELYHDTCQKCTFLGLSRLTESETLGVVRSNRCFPGHAGDSDLAKVGDPPSRELTEP